MSSCPQLCLFPWNKYKWKPQSLVATKDILQHHVSHWMPLQAHNPIIPGLPGPGWPGRAEHLFQSWNLYEVGFVMLPILQLSPMPPDWLYFLPHVKRISWGCVGNEAQGKERNTLTRMLPPSTGFLWEAQGCLGGISISGSLLEGHNPHLSSGWLPTFWLMTYTSQEIHSLDLWVMVLCGAVLRK